MIQTINLHEFRQAFHDHDRSNQFSYEALGLIFEYFEQFEQDTGEPYELDVIALCCSISESTPQEIRDAYGWLELDDADTKACLCDETHVIGETPDGDIVFFQF